jgi:hypothetical protein
MFFVLFESLLSFRSFSHAFICLNHSSYLQSALEKSAKIRIVRDQCDPERYSIALMICPFKHLQYIHYRNVENAS